MKSSRFTLKALFLSSSVALLAACGGGGGGTTTATGVQETGTLTDSIVVGVQYTTSGGMSGTTDSMGRFNYRSGETVTFKIGNFELGSTVVTGSDAIVTPLLLATTAGVVNASKVNNLLVLLQSLDSDADASNGLTIPAAVGAAFIAGTAGAPNLNEVKGVDFAPQLALAITAAGGMAALVDTGIAQAHFKAETMKKLKGTWHLAGTGSDRIFRVLENGGYIFGSVGASATAGIESGTIDLNPLTGEVRAVSVQDTNGGWGLTDAVSDIENNTDTGVSVMLTGANSVLVKQAGEPDRIFTRVVDSAVLSGAAAVQGTWSLFEGDNVTRTQLVFSNGKYFYIYPRASREVCASVGMETGSYTVSAAGAASVLSFSGVTASTDGNGCAGFYNAGAHIPMTNALTSTAGQLSFTVDGGSEVFYFYRTGFSAP